MHFQIERQFKNQEIRVPIRTRGKQRIVVKVYHPKMPNTVYFDAAPVIDGAEMVIVRIPKMPPAVIMEVFNERHGNIQFDQSFQVGKIVSRPISLPFMITKIMNPVVDRFAQFSDEFAEKAGILSARDSIYVSPDGIFKIHYKDVIRDDQGRELRTPARVHSRTKEIEISRKYYLQYSVPARKFLNWHEFAHVYMNENPSDEFEADKHGITFYLGGGNPTVEAYNGILRLYGNTPSELNRQRYNDLNAFIKNFNKIMTGKTGVKTSTK